MLCSPFHMKGFKRPSKSFRRLRLMWPLLSHKNSHLAKKQRSRRRQSRLPSSQCGHRDDLKAIGPGMLQLVSIVIYGYDSISCERFNCVLSCFVRRLLCSSDGCSKMLDEITGWNTG